MKIGVVICGPDVNDGPLALLSGTFEAKVQKAAGLGFDGVELMVRDPHGLDWASVKSILQTSKLGVPQIVTGELYAADGLTLVTPNSSIFQCALERIKSVIDFAAYLDTMVNIGRFRGYLATVGGGKQAWSIALDRFSLVLDYARDKGVPICLEPLNRYESDFINTVSEGASFIAELKVDNIGLMLDLFHMNIEEDSIEESLRYAGDKMWHLHIADSHRRYPGSGHLNFASIFATLREMHYQRYISAEVLPLPDADTAAAKTIDFLKGLIL